MDATKRKLLLKQGYDIFFHGEEQKLKDLKQGWNPLFLHFIIVSKKPIAAAQC